ncbi:hypothetical protein TcYC6_0063930 [Trypanosoma cruzi]|nr:hypothetical protein TcYC6_0063930 [Trypanosoma cruzi]
MLTELRAEIVQLTRRSANAWNTHEGEVQEVVEAVKRMCGYILQASFGEQQRGPTLDERCTSSLDGKLSRSRSND